MKLVESKVMRILCSIFVVCLTALGAYILGEGVGQFIKNYLI